MTEPTLALELAPGGGGCIYKERGAVNPCRKLCDPGETMCPHHRLLADAKSETGGNLTLPSAYRD